MAQVRVGLVQLTSGDDPAANLPVTEAYVREAAAAGAEFVLTPEVTNIVSMSRKRQHALLRHEDDDETLARLRVVAAECGIWLLIGSLAVLSDGPDGRFANRSFLISPDGAIAARYDKIHMFDAVPVDGEAYRESSGYRPGTGMTLAPTSFGNVGMTICYDMRFPELYARLARAGAAILTAPSAFTRPTGRAHWEVLLRARAIETGCFVLAPAQCGEHAASEGRARETYGHSLIISPWGDIIADGAEAPGVTLATLDLNKVRKARARVPSLGGAQVFSGP